jgi:2-dehydropantoate 2-reductase
MSDDLPVTDLMTRAAASDKQAWDGLVEQYAPLVWSICRRHRLSDADVGDISRNIWRQLAGQLGRICDPAALPGWLAATTRRECGKVRRAAPARGSHLQALQAQGLRVASVHGSFELAQVTAADNPAQVGPVDYVLVTVKSNQTAQVAARLRPLLHQDTAVISLQNGVDNEEKLAAVVGEDRVVGGVAYIFSTISQPGVIEHTGGPATLVVGEWRGGRSERVSRLAEACRTAGFEAEETGDIHAVLWEKFAFICAQAGTTAAVRLPIGEIRTAPASRELFRRVAAEVCQVARAEGIALPADLPDRHLAFADGLEPGGYSSLHHDLTHGYPMELEALLGEAIRRGAQAGVATPISQALYAVLKPWQLRNQQ